MRDERREARDERYEMLMLMLVLVLMLVWT